MSAADLHERIAAFVAAYRLAGGEPSATMRAVLEAHPGAQTYDYAIGLGLANRATRRPVDSEAARHG